MNTQHEMLYTDEHSLS